MQLAGQAMGPAIKSGVARKRALRMAQPKPVGVNADTPLFTEARWRQLAEYLELTPRQSEISRCICRGRTYKAIAAETGISINTVRMHMRALFEKLGAHDRLSTVLRIVHADRALATAPTLRRATHTRSRRRIAKPAHGLRARESLAIQGED
jgi:DNA-binding NarL/FixJ family response regulator